MNWKILLVVIAILAIVLSGCTETPAEEEKGAPTAQELADLPEEDLGLDELQEIAGQVGDISDVGTEIQDVMGVTGGIQEGSKIRGGVE